MSTPSIGLAGKVHLSFFHKMVRKSKTFWPTPYTHSTKETLPPASHCVLPKDVPHLTGTPPPHCPPPAENGQGSPPPPPTSPGSQPPAFCFQPQGHRGDQPQGHHVQVPPGPGSHLNLSPMPFPQALIPSLRTGLFWTPELTGTVPQRRLSPPFPLLFSSSPNFSPCIPAQTPAQSCPPSSPDPLPPGS